MQRKTFALKILDGCEDPFLSALQKIWPEIARILDGTEVSNFNLWQVRNLVFGCYEMNDLTSYSLTFSLKNCFDRYESGMFLWISDPVSQMRLFYSDINLLMERKKPVVYKIYIARFRDAGKEMYQKRYKYIKNLFTNRPINTADSNFIIWNADKYLFGYNEADAATEHVMTPDERERITLLKTNTSEILDWITDDSDWISGLEQNHVKRLAWY